LEVRSLSDRESFQYFFAHALLIAIGNAIPDTDWNGWVSAGAIASIVVTCAGILFCYRANGGASGEWFLARMLAVSWVVTVRFVVVGMAVAFVGAVLLYLRVAHHLRRIHDRRAMISDARESAPDVHLAPLA
jgi:hypothetical protein